MSPFGIFAVMLIVIYFLYYGVMISRDLYGKRGKVKSDEEEFDVSLMEEEELAVGVQESSEGFLIDSSRQVAVATPLSGMNSNDLKTQNPTPHSDFGSALNSGSGFNSNQDSVSSPVIDKVQNELEVIDPQGNATVSKEFFKELLLAADKKGSLFLDAYQIKTA